MLRRNSLFLVLVALALTANLASQIKAEIAEYDVKEHYTKYEFRIPMRNGYICSPRSTCPRTRPASTHS
jgi:hypothetical protein